MTGAVIASVIVSFPLMYQHTIQGFRSINPKMLNTARTMGASENKIFYRLILPLSKRSIIAGIMMSFARAIGEFGATLMVAGYIPNKTNTLPLEIYFLVEQGRENQAWLWVLVLVAFSITVIGVLNFANKDKYRGRVDVRVKRHQYQLKRHSLILTLTIQSLKFTQYEGLLE